MYSWAAWCNCFSSHRKLMCLVGNPNELVQKMAYLVPLVERMSTITGALTIMNNRGDDALYLAALNCPQFPFVAGYLAATMLEKGINFTQRLYHTRVYYSLFLSSHHSYFSLSFFQYAKCFYIMSSWFLRFLKLLHPCYRGIHWYIRSLHKGILMKKL